MPTDQATATPWLSVLVPFHNVERYIGECVESILSQADDGVEIVLLDDASPDGSLAIARALQQRAPQAIRIVSHAENRGLSTTRNGLLDAGRGRYFWLRPAELLGKSWRHRSTSAGDHSPLLCQRHWPVETD